MTTNPFWIDVLFALRSRWKNSIIFDKHVIREPPLWFNPIFRLQLRREWKENGILVVSDFINYLTTPLSLEEINQKYNIKMNFLEQLFYKNILNGKKYQKPRKPLPRNSFLNTFLYMDDKGVSNLYRTLNKKGNQIIGEIHHKWEEKTTLNLENIDITRSFVYHNFTDCYLKYTQFRTLHRRFYTNDKLNKMGIKKTIDVHFVLKSQIVLNI